MLTAWMQPVAGWLGGAGLFHYITFRAAAAGLTAFALCALGVPRLLRWCERRRLDQPVRTATDAPACPELPRLQAAKRGIPALGGVVIVLAVLGSTLLWARLDNFFLWLVLIVTVSLAGVGLVDDGLKLLRRRAHGLSCGAKLCSQLLLAMGVAGALYLVPDAATQLEIPFSKVTLPLGVWYLPFAVLVIVATSNAVNITDGLDGLASGCLLLVVATFTIFTYLSGHYVFAGYLGIFFSPLAGELTVFCAAIVGALLAFLWFNTYPASLFMGDSGALALGGAVGLIALLVKKELLLVLVGGIFVAEAASVLLQVTSYRWRNRRKVFLAAPLHHHFQLLGWAEPKVTNRFWIVGVLLALCSLLTLKLR